MDIIKIHTEILKAIKENKQINYFVDKENRKIYLSYNYCFIVILSLSDFYLDLKSIYFRENKACIDIIKDTCKTAADKLIFTNSLQMINKIKTLKFSAVNQEKEKYNIYINEKYLKLYGKLEFIDLYTYGNLRPVIIKQKNNNEILGVITPIKNSNITE